MGKCFNKVQTLLHCYIDSFPLCKKRINGIILQKNGEKLVKQNRYLDFGYENRSGNYSGADYDLIYGPVANDDVYTTFNLYAAGVLTKEQTLEALKVKKLYNQLVLTSEKALSFLHFTGTITEEDE